jgi:SAM-dependent methyltransferase
MASALPTPLSAAAPGTSRREVVCPACGWKSWSVEEERKPRGYMLCRCLVCHLRFCEPMAAASSECYGSSWFHKLREASSGGIRVERTVPWNFARALSAIAPGRGRKLLDVGCADEGHFLYLARRAGFQVTGLGFNPVSLKIAKETFGIPLVYQCSVEELAKRFPDASFDVVTLFEVLEHTADPFGTLRSLAQVMKPGASLLISVPGLDRWPALFHPEVDSPPHHLTLWTEEALRRVLGRVGLCVRSVEGKPLQVDDFAIHVNWRPRGLLPRSGPNASHKRSDNPPRTMAPTARSDFAAMRTLVKGALSPVCALMRLHPRAGGFSLFASCRKP